jgi:hypothetical protein
MRSEDVTGRLSLYHEITGVGLPMASQDKNATELMGRVWLTGPRIMTGGGRSSLEVTVRRVLVDADPAALTAEQIITGTGVLGLCLSEGQSGSTLVSCDNFVVS